MKRARRLAASFLTQRMGNLEAKGCIYIGEEEGFRKLFRRL